MKSKFFSRLKSYVSNLQIVKDYNAPEPDQDIRDVQKEAAAIGVLAVQYMLLAASIKPEPFIKHLVSTEENRFLKLQQIVQKYHPERLAELQSHLAHHVHSSIEQIIAQRASNGGQLTALVDNLLHPIGIANIEGTNETKVLLESFQKSVLSRAGEDIKRAARLEYKKLCESNGKQFEAHKFLDYLDDIEITKSLNIREELLQHTQLRYSER